VVVKSSTSGTGSPGFVFLGLDTRREFFLPYYSSVSKQDELALKKLGDCRPVSSLIDSFRPQAALLRLIFLTCAALSLTLFCGRGAAQSANKTCRVESIVFEGWQARQLSNSLVKIVVVPQLGGRVMQVYFEDHPYLFVNAKYKGMYISPEEAAKKDRWINYGGDKIWPLPEGSQDEHHWPGPISDLLDDGNYEFTVLSETPNCKVRLNGPAEPKTGLQYSREISLSSDSAEIHFHAVMKNIADHPIQWSMQSVTQFDTGGPHQPENYNRDFWAFTPANSNSAYFAGYQVRDGLADDPSFRVGDGLFCLHWLPLENEVWLDSPAGWLAVVDAAAGYGMIEKFHYVSGGDYPGKATVIFYKNGSIVHLDEQGFPALAPPNGETPVRYMEAELNSPVVSLAPGETYAMDTEWRPVHIKKPKADAAPIACAGLSHAIGNPGAPLGANPK
jgi:hypothetical protein